VCHPGVFCDGCQTDAVLKRNSFANGNMTRRGFISGIRYKSETVHDFDLCESCHQSGTFTEAAYGPFVVVNAPATATGGRCGGSWWDRGGQGENWRARHCQPTTTTSGTDQKCEGETCETKSQREKPTQEEPPKKKFDFGDLLRDAISKGAAAVAEATQGEDNEFAEIARAIAASLQEKKPATDGGAPAESAAPVSESPKPTSRERESDDWESVPEGAKPEEIVDPFVKWANQLHQLSTLGFSNSETYITFLEEENGDLDRVVSRIVSRNA